MNRLESTAAGADIPPAPGCPGVPGERSPGLPFRGPGCVIKMADLGIAVGSAVKTASIHNVDNRVMTPRELPGSHSAGLEIVRWVMAYHLRQQAKHFL